MCKVSNAGDTDWPLIFIKVATYKCTATSVKFGVVKPVAYIDRVDLPQIECLMPYKPDLAYGYAKQA